MEMSVHSWEGDLQQLPAYVEALRAHGHTCNLYIKSKDEMMAGLARLMTAESKARAEVQTSLLACY